MSGLQTGWERAQTFRDCHCESCDNVREGTQVTDNAREDRVAPRTAAGHNTRYAKERTMTRPVPRTQAGQVLDLAWPGTHLDRLGWRDRILAIEAEAASLDSDELRKALTDIRSLSLDMPPAWNDEASFYRDGLRSAIGIAVRALLSAGDKAEAPLDE